MIAMRLLRPLSLALPLVACSAFEAPPPPEFDVVVKVEGDPGRPVKGATVLFEATEVGVTDEAGAAQLRLSGKEGQSFSLDVTCPDGYASPRRPVMVTLRATLETSKPPQYAVSCPPTVRRVVVAVRAQNGPDLPVMYLGQEKARTDASGAAHFTLELPPNQPVSVSLDTSSNPRLLPQSPSAEFEVKDRDEVFVFDQEFKEKRVRTYSRARPSGPTRL